MWLAWGDQLALLCNPACAEIFDGGRRHAPGMPLAAAWPDGWPALDALAAGVRAGRAARHDGVPLAPQGRDHGHAAARRATLSCSPLRDADGTVRGLLGTLHDTAPAPAAAAVRDDAPADALSPSERETEERYRLARLASNDAIWDWRLADGTVVWNRALHTLFGHDLELASFGWWLDHVHPDDRARIHDSARAVLDGAGTAWSGAYRFRRADGSYADVLDRGTVLRDAGGRALRMIGAMLDVTERKAADRALHESERLFRFLFESIDEGFCVIEFLDGPHGPLSDYVHVMANPAYASNAGIQNVVGQRVREMVPLEADGWVETYRRVLLTGEPVRFERELERTGRYLELSALRIEPPERRQVAVLFQDGTQRHRAERAIREMNDTLERRVADGVAERVRMEEALRQAQKMEAVGQLTGGIAHDFNNMLAVVSSALGLLGKRLADGDARALHYVDMARTSVKRAAQLTQRLLAFSRQQALKPEALSVNQLVAGMSDLLAHSLGAHVRVETALAGSLWHTHVDANQLENTILNLAVNARDAMADGGRLAIETANFQMDARWAAEHPGLPSGQYVMLAVGDSGSGMTPEVLAKAFEPFFTTKEVGRGTGLGLSQVYGFVKQSGGHVEIDSAPGSGTVVRIYLPRHAGAPDPQARPAADGATGAAMAQGSAGETILVMEDEAAVRALSVDMLGGLGYRVLEADGAAAALRLLDAHPGVTLLFTDLIMPEMNGRRLAEEALARRPALKVLFTTGYTGDTLGGGTAGGAPRQDIQLVGKPFTIEELAARVRAVLDQRA
ncbi:PAS domain S-box protein [Massilia forsythiae]|uniref:histidine kinase n=2 Tax=Massilia forsythiae TaxID=2728020 RepID=A0A7Z2W1K2_9BURK|nr:PAS domain S-box protein [Massilia forsythiae]